MIQIRNLHVTIGRRELLKGVDWMIHPGKHMALIGPNGAGKTTLFRIIHGDLTPDQGDLVMPKGTVMGYLPQEEVTVEDVPLLESVMQRQKELARLEKQISDIQHRLDGEKNPSKTILDRLGQLEHHFSALGGYEIEHQAGQILSGLGFQKPDFQKPISQFSGGWRMRSVLASLLLQDPDVLLLDEPTNHLDLPSLEWLEQYLAHFQGSVVIISHDRFFIDRLATDIYELDRGRLTHYPGNYHFYEKKKAEALELLKKEFNNQQDELKRQQAFVDRFRYKATKARAVQSRIKQMEKVERIELPGERKTWSFEIQIRRPSYKDVLHIRDMSFRYNQDWVLDGINLSIYRGEKLAMVGVNGAGKTTLTRLIFGDLKPQKGSVDVGQRVEIGYYSQHQIDALDLNKTIMEEVSTFSEESTSQRIRNVLGIFQFTGDDVFKQIGILSGGEKARVSLAKMLLSEANFLIMDEPTNHLDLISKEALEEALQRYDGTLLLISHDRYFLTKLVHKVIEVKDKKLCVMEGNYSDYLERRLAEETTESNQDVKEKKAQTDSGRKKNKEQRRQEAQARDALNKLKKPVMDKIHLYESNIEKLEAQKQELETRMADPATYNQDGLIMELQKQHAETDRDLKACYKEWEALQEELEKIIGKL